MNDNVSFKAIIIAAVFVAFVLIFTNYRRIIVNSEYDISKNNDNEVAKIYIGEKDIVEKYYSEFISIALSDKIKAYSMLDAKYKENVSYDDFLNKLNELESNEYYKYSIQAYEINDNNDEYKLYYVKNEIGNEFIFKETSIMNYTVYLDFDSIK